MINTNVILGIVLFIVGSGFAMKAGGMFSNRFGILGAILCTSGLLLIAGTYTGLIPNIGA